MSTELTSLQVMRLVHDTEEAAVAPLREVAGESVRWLKPRALSEVCAGLLREAERVVLVERQASSRLRDSLTLSDQREAEAHAALDRAGAPKSALLADRVRDLEVRVNERLGEVRANGDETARVWCLVAQKRGQVLTDIRRALTLATQDPSDALSTFARDLLPRVEGEAIHWTPPLPEIDEDALERRFWLRREEMAAVARELKHDGVEDPAVKPAPVTEFPHPLTGRDPMTAAEAPPAEYAEEADALGVQS